MIKTIIVFVILLLNLTSCKDEQKIVPSSKTVKVGVLAPLSGKYKRLGHQSLLGLQAAQKMYPYLNNGDKIVFDIIDTKSELEASKTALSKLVENNVSAVFSLMSSNEMVAMREVFQTHKTPIIATLATDDSIAYQEGYVSQVCMDNMTQVLVASHFIRDERLMKYAGVVYDNDSVYSRSLAHEFREYFTQLGGDVKFSLDVSTEKGMETFKKQKSDAIEVLFMPVDAIISSKILKTVYQQGLNYKVVGTDSLLSDVYETSAKNLDYFEGVYVVDHYTHNEDKKIHRQQFERLMQYDGFEESSYAYLSYDGYQLLRYAMDICKEYDPVCLNAIMHNSDSIQGISSNFSMINAKVKREVFIDRIHKSSLQREVAIF